MASIKKKAREKIELSKEKRKTKIKNRNKLETIGVFIFGGVILVLELIKADIIPIKDWLLNGFSKDFPTIYSVVWGWYENVYEFAGNSFTQVTAFFSAFASITFFIIGRFNEGIIGVPLEELLDIQYNRDTIEKRKKFILFSPILVCIFIILDTKLLAFFIGMLTLANVIFSAYCAFIATDRNKQNKIAWRTVKIELNEISTKLENENDSKNEVFSISDRYYSKTLSKMVNAMSLNRNLFCKIGDSVFDWLFDKEDDKCKYNIDIVFYNIQSMVYDLLKNLSSKDEYSFAFLYLEKQLRKKACIRLKEENKALYDSIIIAIICGVILSKASGGEKLIENIFEDPWGHKEITKQKLCLLLFLEHLYFNDQKEIALYWAKKLFVSRINFFRNSYVFCMDENSYYFWRYLILWERREKNLSAVNLNIFNNLLIDIQSIDSENNKIHSFIGGIIKGRKRVTNEKYM